MRKPFYLFLLVMHIGVLHAQKQIENFIFFNLDRDRIQEKSFLETRKFVGAQLKYNWKELEPEKDKYNFSEISKDLNFLTAHGKKLFIQLQDVTFDTIWVDVPHYLLDEPEYDGGVAMQIVTDDKDSIIETCGYVARRWDVKVAERFYKLIIALGKEFDGKIEGINFPETSVDFGESGKSYPKGFTPTIYRDAILKQMEVAKLAFSKSVVIQYANFMPGEWLPHENKGYLESLYYFASINCIGMGGPDIKIYNKAHMNHGYKFLMQYSNDIKTGIAVQDGNYEEINPKTGKQVTVDEIYNFGNDELGLDYIFWSTQEPFYTEFLIPYFTKR
jgi:hypothetical protein